ncbi:hypothetical protein [Clostridium sp.]|uniref:hypothetical protein n=1 Tax=Clostridium sp. TaxID=1506 RepID=UPI00284235F3|nr:hypothetical protein [Clostridium sp.]MDR3595831.1 hypothetical protein [Clostridium sp.]
MISNTIKKKFPSDYPEQYLVIIYAMAFSHKNVYIEGTYSMRGLLYPSDVDCFEKVQSKYKNTEECINNLEKQFKEIIKRLMKMKNVIIGKIVAGKVNNKPLKWKPNDILKGVKDGVKLRNTFTEPSLFKIDVIAYINSVYLDFSTTYQFYNNNTLLNKYELFQPKSLDEDIQKFKEEGNYYKMAKRMFVKSNNNKKFVPLFNSEAGAMNQVMGSIDTLIYLLENRGKVSFKNIDNEIDDFINKLGLLANKKLVNNSEIVPLLKQAENTTVKKTVIRKLTTIENKLNKIVQPDSKQYLSDMKLI